MSETFDRSTIDRVAKQLREPSWLTDLRRRALSRHADLPWPHVSDDVWRRTDSSLLDPSKGFSPTAPELLQPLAVPADQLPSLIQPLGDEELLVRVHGTWVTPPRASELLIGDLSQSAAARPEPIRRIMESDGLSDAEQKFTTLNGAFHDDDVAIHVPAGYAAPRPIRMVHVSAVAARHALFPLTVITIGAGSVVTLIDEYVSLPADSSEEPHLINGRIDLVIEPNARVHYVRLQRWDRRAREFLLQRTTVAEGATLTMANLNLGASLSKTHLVTRLEGPHASTKLYGFVFGHRAQHIDQHTLQDHHAPNTTSDLQFKAALQDCSRVIYTGLIRIAKQAKQTQAYQANHNLLLSQTARAETIPMLEILADDVQCKHGASVGPIDDEQAFYLRSRGIPRDAAERLIVMGFVSSIIEQVPFAPLQERLRDEIEGNLHQGTE